MNFIRIHNNEVLSSNIQNKFCDRFFKEPIHKSKCFKFVTDRTSVNSQCPYGFACTKGNNLVICGYLIENNFDQVLIRHHEKNTKDFTKEIITKDQYHNIKKYLNLYENYSIYSQTKHELTHFIGQLKNLIEAIDNNCDPFIREIIERYHKYIIRYSQFEIDIEPYYNFTREVLNNPDVDINVLSSIRTLESLSSLIELIKDYINDMFEIGNEIHKTIKDLGDYEEQYSDDWNAMSLIAMQSLFHYRLKYHFSCIETNSLISSGKKRLYKWHNMAMKHSRMMRLTARKKDTDFDFSGSNYVYFLGDDNVYLALYILFENAVKYSLKGKKINVCFYNEGEKTCIKVANNSDFVSPESLCKIFYRGYSGENSKNLSSNGLGLYLVKIILDDNDFEYDYNYENGIFYFIIKAPIENSTSS